MVLFLAAAASSYRRRGVDIGHLVVLKYGHLRVHIHEHLRLLLLVAMVALPSSTTGSFRVGAIEVSIMITIGCCFATAAGDLLLLIHVVAL